MHNASFDENSNRRSAESKQFVFYFSRHCCLHSYVYPYVSSWWATIFTVTNRSVRNYNVNIHMSLKNISLAWELNWAAEKTRKSNIWYHHKISQEIFKGPNIYLSRCAVSLLFSFTLVFFFSIFISRQSGRVKNSTLFSIVFAACFCGFLPFFHLKKIYIKHEEFRG
jgi:hypothetical protein